MSPIFVVPKSDGTYRLIFSFKKCNKAVLSVILRWHPVHSYWFDHSGLLYGFIRSETCLLFLLCLLLLRSSGGIWNSFGMVSFMNLVHCLWVWLVHLEFLPKSPLAFLRKKGYTLTGYISDFFLQGNDADECLANIKETLKVFLSLGFTVNSEKSAACTYPGIDLFGICFKFTFDDGHNVTRKERKIEISFLGSLE